MGPSASVWLHSLSLSTNFCVLIGVDELSHYVEVAHIVGLQHISAAASNSLRYLSNPS